MERRIAIWTVVCCLVLAGCSTVAKGSSQDLKIASLPSGAECELTRSGRIVGKVTTPGSVKVTRSQDPIVVVCTKEGYDDARGVMNSLTDTPIMGGPGIIGGVIAAGALIDMASGANLHYQGGLTMRLEPLSAADLVARGQTLPASSPSPMKTTAATPTLASTAKPIAPGAAAGPYDGSYAGSVDVLQTNVSPPIPHLRTFNVRVVNGVGSGTVKHALCDQPGEVFFLVERDGSIKGKANTQNTSGCTPRMTMLEGRAEASEIRITLRLMKNPTVTLTRMSEAASVVPVTAASPGVPSTPTEIECVGTGGTRLRVTATACPAPLTRAQ